MKNRLRKVQFKYLDYVFENMRSVKSKHYLDSTFFKKGDKVILELEKSGTLWVLYSVWSNISDTFSFEYEETQQLIKEWMEEQLKSREVIPSGLIMSFSSTMEEELKQEEVEPIQNASFIRMEVEEQIKQVEIEPLDAGSNYLPFMEKQIKSEEVIPHTSITNQLMRVQEELKSVEIKPVKDVNLICQLAELRLNREEVTPYIDKERELLQVSYHLKVVEEQLKKEEVTPRSAIPPQSWTNLKSEEIKPVKFYENELQVFEEQLKQEILKLSKDEKK
jgi:hypothetical protein